MLSHQLTEGYSTDRTVTYWYEGECPQTRERLRLPRTIAVEAIARELMQQLASDSRYSREGKMYGVLLVEAPSGEHQVLKAFSGLLHGETTVSAWVPPIPGRDHVALEEARTLAALATLKQNLTDWQQIPERQQYQVVFQEYTAQLQRLVDCHHQRRQGRQQQRQHLLNTHSGDALNKALTVLDDQSRRDGIERRHLKQQWKARLQPLQQAIAQADAHIQTLKQQRKQLSQQLQSLMHASYCITNFAGRSQSLQAFIAGKSFPTGTGDCCAPKLLHYAATQGLKPLAMAEFWWGPSPPRADKIQGEFYGACPDRCQPLMGFLLSGLPQSSITPALSQPLSILYEDDWIIAVNKPAGLLSVPGRYRDRQDSVLSRLRQEGRALTTVHRLDQDTSGILLLARDAQTHRLLSQQFQQRRVHKRYEAILAGPVLTERGVIDLPVWSDPDDRPYQKIDWQRGKSCVTQFQVLARESGYTRVELNPITGRTHQLRVHAAAPEGLGVVILGDRLYGCCAKVSRLHLHARELRIQHPYSGEVVPIFAETPF